MPALTRRRFLSLTGGAGALLGVGGWSYLVRDHVEEAASNPKTGRTLVVVELHGGNDTLNTVVPDDGRYRDARPTIGVADGDVLRPEGLDGAGLGLHPSLDPLVDLWSAGELAIVQSLGYSHAGRSHFECSQHWWDGTHVGEPSTTGWLGRWLDATAPEGEPGGGNPLRAVALGGGSPALRAERTVATVVTDPGAFAIQAPQRVDAEGLADLFAATAAPLSPDGLVAAAQHGVTAALEATERLADPLATVTGGDGTGSGPGDRGGRRAGGDRFVDLLTLAAELVTRRLGIQVVTLSGSGFDTHANQPDTHAALLADLAGGLEAFWGRLREAGMADDALVMTTSEFGRRVAENGSLGTDHGLGGCQFLVGPAVRGGVVGDLDLAHLHEGDLNPTIDPRSFYAAAIDWLGGPTDEVLDSYENLDLLA